MVGEIIGALVATVGLLLVIFSHWSGRAADETVALQASWSRVHTRRRVYVLYVDVARV